MTALDVPFYEEAPAPSLMDLPLYLTFCAHPIYSTVKRLRSFHLGTPLTRRLGCIILKFMQAAFCPEALEFGLLFMLLGLLIFLFCTTSPIYTLLVYPKMT